MKILIIRLSSIGDVIMTTPIIRCIKKSTKAQLFFLTNLVNHPVLSSNPFIDKIFAPEDISTHDINSMSLIIDLHNHKKSRAYYRHTKINYLRTDKMPIRKWLMLLFKINLLDASHVIDRHFDCIKNISTYDDGIGMDIYYTNPYNSLVINREPDIIINVGGSKMTKRIPKSLVQQISLQTKRSITLIGGEDVLSEYGNLTGENMTNLVGTLSLQESFYLLNKCNILITGDSAMMHAAAAMNKDQIIIWGSTSREFGFSPYYGFKHKNRAKSIEQSLPCRPCSKYGRDVCPKGHLNCLVNISAKEVLLTMNSLQ